MKRALMRYGLPLAAFFSLLLASMAIKRLFNVSLNPVVPMIGRDATNSSPAMSEAVIPTMARLMKSRQDRSISDIFNAQLGFAQEVRYHCFSRVELQFFAAQSLFTNLYREVETRRCRSRWYLTCAKPLSYGSHKMPQTFALIICTLFISMVSAAQSLPCANALARRAVCAAANRRAVEIMRARRLKAVTVVQDVRTGALVAFAASQPSEVNITTPIRPLSLSKLFLSASWWDNRQPDTPFDSTAGISDATNPAYRSRVTLHEMLVGGSDSAGRQAAIALRKSVGTKKVLEDFARYFLLPDDKFWGELDPLWKESLTPAPASISLTEETKDEEWADTLSLGETNMSVTALHISRFLQAVGNGGMQLIPLAREQTKSGGHRPEFRNPIRIMDESTALQLQSAMRDTVQRGTAKSIASALSGTGWQIGGKTGSGPALLPKGDLVDGWFAGLIFDPEGKARFTVATFVRSGGKGGENAARISAELARYLLGAKNSQ